MITTDRGHLWLTHARPLPVTARTGRPGRQPRRIRFRSTFKQRPTHLELDLAGVSFLDTGGVRVLLQSPADARQLGCRLTLTNVQPEPYRVLKIVDLLEPFGVAEPAAA